MYCPCGSEVLYDGCCGLFHLGEQVPETAEQLMRSRYAAYAKGALDYIQKTMAGDALKKFSMVNTATNMEQVQWKGLKVIASTEDTVEFRAYYEVSGRWESLHETSTFEKIDGQWFYVDGVVHGD